MNPQSSSWHLFAWISGLADAHAGQVYCYARRRKAATSSSVTPREQCTIYVTRSFHSGRFGVPVVPPSLPEALPDAGLATCVTDEYDADLAGWTAVPD